MSEQNEDEITEYESIAMVIIFELLKQFAIFTTLHIDHKAKTTKRFCGSNRVKIKFLGFHYVLRFKDCGLIKFIPKFDR